MKELPVDILNNDDITEFISNVKQMAMLKSSSMFVTPKIICCEQGHLCLFSDFNANGNLSSFLATNKNTILSWVLRRDLIVQLAKAVHFLHQKNMSHRGLKPKNILMGAKNTITLSDIASLFPKLRYKISEHFDVKFAWRYMSIEQLRGVVAISKQDEAQQQQQQQQQSTLPNVTSATDSFSFALIAWQILTQSQTVFEDYDSPEDLLEAMERGVRPSLPRTNDKQVNNLCDVLNNCWAAEPSSRPSFAQIVASLKF